MLDRRHGDVVMIDGGKNGKSGGVCSNRPADIRNSNLGTSLAKNKRGQISATKPWDIVCEGVVTYFSRYWNKANASIADPFSASQRHSQLDNHKKNQPGIKSMRCIEKPISE
jgi:hypothetical protein